MNTRKAFPVEFPIQVRSYDIDALGHVNNIVYIRWLEDLRTAILDTYLPYDKLMQDRISPVLTRTEIDYKKPVKLFEEVTGRAWIENVSGVRMQMHFEISVDGQCRASAVQHGIFYHIDRERPVKPPMTFREQWKAYIEDHS